MITTNSNNETKYYVGNIKMIDDIFYSELIIPVNEDLFNIESIKGIYEPLGNITLLYNMEISNVLNSEDNTTKIVTYKSSWCVTGDINPYTLQITDLKLQFQEFDYYFFNEFEPASEKQLLFKNDEFQIYHLETTNLIQYFFNKAVKLKDVSDYIRKIGDLPFKCFIAFLYYTGCRKSEVRALSWNDIDWQYCSVEIFQNLSDKNLIEGVKKTNTKN